MEDGKAETSAAPQPTPPTEDPTLNAVGSHKPGEPENSPAAEKIPNGHVRAEPLENGEASEPPGAAGDPARPPTSARPDPGVASFPHSLEKPDGSAHKSDALQSLRLSIPMQETELSSEPSLEMENEEKIRLEARRRLEEQLKQYRVQRHKERSHRSTAKSRPFSTLDPELMLHPEGLPRASTVAMTTEYSFLRTSVPRGPKLGSLGGIPPAKDRKSKSTRSNKIHSLADYRTPEPDTKASEMATPSVSVSADTSFGSVQSAVSSVSMVSEISVSSGPDAPLESTRTIRDNVSEVDGNDSDSSSYSSASAPYGVLALAASRAAAPYTVEGREVAAEAVGQFPPLRDVLQAASEEQQQLMELEQEREGTEPRSRRDSFSSSVSYGSSVMGTHDEMLQVLKEKMRLEGQLESLSSEASQALKEKTELQAQLAAVNAQLQAQTEEARVSVERQSSLASEVSTLRADCSTLERAMTDLQTQLEDKNASLTSLGNDLQVAEEQYQRLMGRVEEMQQSMTSKDSTVSDLRQQLSSLQAQLQQVQSERSALHSRLQTSQAEVQSLQQLRSWYQQQLALAQEARVRLQTQMANMQAGQMTQIGVLENLKMENVSLSHQLSETKHRSIKEKERIAVQLQSIEADMLTQEAAIQQIHDAKSMVEEDLQHKLEEFEEEREQLLKMANSATTLERELEQVKVALSQKDAQLASFQREHVELMKQLTAAQESLQGKDQALQLLEARYAELEAQLQELQADSSTRDDELHFLRNEKIVLEVALQAARVEKSQLDDGAERLGEDVLAAADTLDQLRQEVQVKATQIESLQQENVSLKKQAQKLKEQFTQQKVMVEAYRRDASSKEQLISELKASKKRLAVEVKELKEEVLKLQGEKASGEQEQQRLLQEVQRVQHQMSSLEQHLQTVQTERDQLDTQLQSLQLDHSQLNAVTEENEALKKKLEQMQEDAKKAISEQKVRMKRLGTDLTSAQKEMKAKHKAYENAVGILSRRLQEALTEKETAEAELVKLRAQVDEGGNNQALQVKLEALQAELKAVLHSKALLEKELQEVISLTSAELEEYQEKVLELEDELQESRCFKKRIRRLEEANKKLALELEHEKGKLAGLGQSHSALREHANILETALAKREADLVQLNLQVQAVLKRKEEEDQQMRQLVQTLQTALEKERIKVKDLTEQVAEAKLEAGHNRRHYRAAVLELSDLRKDLQAKEELLKSLQEQAKTLEAQDAQRSQEVSRFQTELTEAHAQLQILQKQLDDELNKQPLTNQEVEDLKWEVEQKQREIEAQRHQLELSEQSSQRELDSVQDTLQRVRVELELVQEELNSTKKDKFVLQAKVAELRSSMKTLLQQNTQLKQDLKHSRTRKRMDAKGDSTPVTPVKIPDCPVPASLLDELLKPSASVNKEPLNNLHNCLRQLKQEMDSLQKQMEEHTVTVASLASAEDELNKLGIHENCPRRLSKEEESETPQEMEQAS
ncbi:golgin subfamily A member 3 isoform X1 [Pygocentrus nattereri]|uniref:Golgin A3 n=1 Tax=Pygocentrus nattereri TaxID=42514 RepID=A0AAR2KD06_PYGNA|nr:golgin subfamily A member 3 isoform X1 [Pygocentrus nattereri]XP_017580693.2 golgin subfamily A member 3 isoform X1 [Pygocentrus nattereri]